MTAKVQLQKKISGHDPQGAWHKYELIDSMVIPGFSLKIHYQDFCSLLDIYKEPR
jgi:hypothetical protein